MSRSGTGGKNLFEDEKNELGLSPLAYEFIGGVMHNAEALAAFTNPTVNSYKRINAAAHHIRRHLVAQHHHLDRQQPHAHDPRAGSRPLRVPPRRWRRKPLSAAGGHPGAGLDGIENKRDPGKPLFINMYTEGHTVKDAKRLPLNLLDALRNLCCSAIKCAALHYGLSDRTRRKDRGCVSLSIA
jgi:glutamine synthetase